MFDRTFGQAAIELCRMNAGNPKYMVHVKTLQQFDQIFTRVMATSLVLPVPPHRRK